MHLTQFTNYAFRTLIYVALHEGQPVSLKRVADSYGISYNHLKKVAACLIDEGYLAARRGRQGGLVLAQKPEDIRVGDVFRLTEGPLHLFECFSVSSASACPLVSVCKLKSLLCQALEAFLSVIDKATLADLIDNREDLRACLGLDG